MGICLSLLETRQARFRPRPAVVVVPEMVNDDTAFSSHVVNNPPTWKSSEPFAPPPINSGYVVKVYDGDTIWVARQMELYNQGLKWYRFNIRIRGIDTPEMKGKDITEDEKQAAKVAQKYLSDLIMGQVVELDDVSDADKYGRLLADVYIHGRNVADMMIVDRMGVPYGGETKHVPESWLDFQAGNSTTMVDVNRKKKKKI